ncbi:MAG: flagellar hook basal-body protein [Sedimentisphaerales bacterium]|nr:flagellar hook basal-body protein [Sedimentisphaerales bacterium]
MSEITNQISSSIDALMKEYEIITNNLANVSTVGFKRRCNAFSKAMEEQDSANQTYTPGTVELESAFDFSQGNMTETGRELDFALMGKGFFVIETPDGPLYTRNGTFNIDQNGQIVDMQGRIVAGESGTITIPSSVSVSEVFAAADGTVSAHGATLGKFKLVDFADNQNKLAPVGCNCFMVTEEGIEPSAAENIIVKQRFLEASNVQIVEELVDMMMVTRMYEANMEFLNTNRQASSSLMSVAMG